MCVTSGGQERVVQPQGLIPRLCLRAAGDLEETLVSLGTKEMLSPCTKRGRKGHVDLPEEKQDTRLNLNFTQMVNNLSVEWCPKHCMQNYLH